MYAGLFESETGEDDRTEQDRDFGSSEGFAERWGEYCDYQT
jgi:hypothetical protein